MNQLKTITNQIWNWNSKPHHQKQHSNLSNNHQANIYHTKNNSHQKTLHRIQSQPDIAKQNVHKQIINIGVNRKSVKPGDNNQNKKLMCEYDWTLLIPECHKENNKI